MAFFQNANRFISKDIEGREKISDQMLEITPEDARNEYENVRKDVKSTILTAIKSHSWMTKAARNTAINDPYYIGRHISPFIAVVATAAMIGTSQDYLLAFSVFVLAIMLFIGCNPFDIVSRYLSRQTRALACTTIFLDMCSIYSGSIPVMGAAEFWTAFIILICILMNKRWLMSYNLLHSESTISALLKAPSNAGVIAWEEPGKRETRTVLSDLGLPFDDDVLQMFAKPIFLVGYHNAWFSTAEDIRKREEAEEQVRKKDIELIVANNTIDELKENLSQSEKSNNQLTESNKDIVSELAESRKRIQELEIEISKYNGGRKDIKVRIAELRADTDENGKPMTYSSITEILHSEGYTEAQSTIARIGRQLEKEAS